MALRLLVINNILTPYNVSFFAALHTMPGVVARCIMLAPNDRNREWTVSREGQSFDYRILPSLYGYIERTETPLYFHWGLWREMRHFGPDVVAICGYHYFATLEVLAFCRLYGIPAVLWSGSHLRSGFVKRRWADLYKRAVIRRFTAYLTYGTAARDQLIHYGASGDRIVVGCNTVDVHWFRARAEALRPRPRTLGNLRLLYVGRLVAIKNVSALVTAVGALQREGHEVSLDIVGGGPGRSDIETQIRAEQVRNVSFLGFRSGDSLVQAYIDADALVLPSLNEPWGLVVNEAAACGIPSVVSLRAGAAADLIEDGVTGYTFDPERPGHLEETLRRLAAAGEERRKMGARAQAFILTRDPAYYAARLVEAARLAQTVHAR